MLPTGLRSIAGLLLYGDMAATEAIARDLVARGDSEMWQLLAETVRSDEEMSARIRCLEVLAKAAYLGDEATARHILAALNGNGEKA